MVRKATELLKAYLSDDEIIEILIELEKGSRLNAVRKLCNSDFGRGMNLHIALNFIDKLREEHFGK